MKTLVLGIGNPILSDDGVGIKVAQEVGKKLDDPQITVSETSAAGLSLLDSLIGYDKVIIIDAIQTERGKAGQIYRMKPEDFSFTKRVSSPHQINLVTALELGQLLNLTMPREISIFAVEAEDITSFSEKCTHEVEQAIPEVAKMVLDELVG
jgi:hydrogenase maturation protease